MISWTFDATLCLILHCRCLRRKWRFFRVRINVLRTEENYEKGPNNFWKLEINEEKEPENNYKKGPRCF